MTNFSFAEEGFFFKEINRDKLLHIPTYKHFCQFTYERQVHSRVCPITKGRCGPTIT